MPAILPDLSALSHDQLRAMVQAFVIRNTPRFSTKTPKAWPRLGYPSSLP